MIIFNSVLFSVLLRMLKETRNIYEFSKIEYNEFSKLKLFFDKKIYSKRTMKYLNPINSSTELILYKLKLTNSSDIYNFTMLSRKLIARYLKPKIISYFKSLDIDEFIIASSNIIFCKKIKTVDEVVNKLLKSNIDIFGIYDFFVTIKYYDDYRSFGLSKYYEKYMENSENYRIKIFDELMKTYHGNQKTEEKES